MDPDKNRRQLLGSRLHSVRQSLLITMIRFIWAAICLLALPSLALPPHVSAQNTRLEKAASDVAAATASYRAALERVLTLYERELARRNDMTELRQDLFERGVLSRREFEEGQRAVADAQKNVDDTRQAIAEADRMMTEARLA
jgi:hypothetical protein